MQPRVLFVCVENSCRSQMAEAFARHLGGGRIEALSAGSRPSGHVHPEAIASMRRAGYDLSSQFSKSVDAITGSLTAIVSMGCGDACPSLPAERRIEWDIPDPKGLPPGAFDAIRDRIEAQVRALLATL